MEKRKPSHELEAFKTAFALHLPMTKTAILGARDLGYSRTDVGRLVNNLTQANFIKSMTSYGDHRQWQDVYHLEDDERLLYIKITDHIVTEFIMLSFKRK